MNALARNLRAASNELAAHEQRILQAIEDSAWIDGDADDLSDFDYWRGKLGAESASYAN
jgi:hypothetical protein